MRGPAVGAGRGTAPARRRVPLVGAGLACLAAAGLGVVLGGPARADNTPGSGLGSFGLTASAPGMQLTWDYPTAATHPIGEGDVPHSLAQLQSGPQGYALASVAWPGSLVGNAGSTSQLVGLGLPPSTSNSLNDPIRAEARTGSGSPTSTNDSYPGTHMAAGATDSDVNATASVAGSTGPFPGMSTGNTVTTSDARLSGASTAVSTANSRVQNIVLGGGVVKIASVTSTATATTDGQHAKGHGSTVVTGMTVAGQPVTIDQSGVHVGQAGAPANAAASAIVDQALAGAGMKLYLSLPSDRPDGASDTYDAGTLVFVWNVPNSNGQVGTATFGGASATVGAAPGLNLDTALPAPAGPAAAPVGGGDTGTAALPAPGGDLGTPTAASGGGTGGGASPGFVPSRTLGLPSGLSWVWPVLAVLGSFLVAGGMRRLPDRVLEGPATTCPLGEDT